MSECVFITGANRGLGLSMTRHFLAKGLHVIASARNLDRAKALQALKDQSFPGILSLVSLDVLEESSMQSAAQAVAAQVERLDILINNAGVHPEQGDESFEELRIDDFQTAFATNVLGVIRCCRAFGPLLQKSSRARVINMSSGSGSISNRDDNHRRYCYGASKAALNHFTRSLAHDWKDRGVAVLSISPGWVQTEMGGPDAPLQVDDAVGSLVETVLRVGIEQTGKFLDKDGNEGAYLW